MTPDSTGALPEAMAGGHSMGPPSTTDRRLARGPWLLGAWAEVVGAWAKGGRGWPRLAEIGRGWPRLAEVGRGWPRLAEIGRDWPRLAEIGRGCPEIRRERPSLASFCVGTLSRCLTSLTLGFRFREIHSGCYQDQLWAHARWACRSIYSWSIFQLPRATHDFGRCRRWGNGGRLTTRLE